MKDVPHGHLDHESPLSVLMLTHNEESNLPFALASLSELGAKVFVVDSGSTDRTVEIAKAHGCTVVYHEWVNHAVQLNWAIDHIDFGTQWLMRLDADERLTPDLAREIRERLTGIAPDVTGLMVKRRVLFWGKWIKHGGYYPTWLLRIWRTGKARCEARWMDEHMVVDHGRVLQLDHDIIDENHKGLSFWVEKHNRYADREVLDILAAQAVEEGPVELAGQAKRKRWLKKNIYNRSPLFYRAAAYWGMRYWIQGGFLDGKEGFVFHLLQGLFYRLLVDAKLYERARKD